MVTFKNTKNGFQDQLLLNAGQNYCRMLQGEHSTIFLTFIKLPFVIKNFVLSIFEWPFYTGFTILLLDNKIAQEDQNSSGLRYIMVYAFSHSLFGYGFKEI